MKERVPLLVGVFLVIALLYAALEFVIIRSPGFGLLALAGAIAVAIIVAFRLRPVSPKDAGDH
jgi:hypothetical protein